MRSWDCGLACVAMTLKTLGFKQVFLEDLIKNCRAAATWTIDLAYLLHEFGVRVSYYTTIRGVRPEYLTQSFYKKMHDPSDTNRILQRFNDAKSNGVNVTEEKLKMSDIQRAIVEKRQLALVLVDVRLLRCIFCTQNHGTQESIRSYHRNPDGFLGHYVLLYAYHEESNYFLMKDPASGREFCMVSAPNLELSRLAFGTDEDIILIGKARVMRESHANSVSNSSHKTGIIHQELTGSEMIQRPQPSVREAVGVVVTSISSHSNTIGRDALNFILRKVFGVSIPRTKLP
ncbi:unnamed protein product [Agarophyton chilense]